MNLDHINHILLHSDLNMIRQWCLTCHKIYQWCGTCYFWQEKLKHDNLPPMIFDEMRNMERISDSVELKNQALWFKLYQTMKDSYREAKGIVLINKVEKSNCYNGGTICMDFEDTYEMEEDGGAEVVKALFPFKIEGKPLEICISLLKDCYELRYKMEIEKRIVDRMDTINEQQVIHMLTLFLYDYHTIIGYFDITDFKGGSFINNQGSGYKQAIWDVIHANLLVL